MDEHRLELLYSKVKLLYTQQNENILYHGWHHIYFVFQKAALFANDLDADRFLVKSAALVHDINYLIEPNSPPEIGFGLRENLLRECGYSENEIADIEKIILEAHTAYRDENISLNAMALSDADSLFKALPVTPIMFSSKYLLENHVDLAALAEKIITEQAKFLEVGNYFYSAIAKDKYLKWAEINLCLWRYVLECMDDPEIIDMLAIAKHEGAI